MWIIHARKDSLFRFFRASRGYGVNGLRDKNILLGAIFFISTLFKFSSEKKNFCSELFYPYFGGKKSGLDTSRKYLQIKGAGEPIKGFLRPYSCYYCEAIATKDLTSLSFLWSLTI